MVGRDNMHIMAPYKPFLSIFDYEYTEGVGTHSEQGWVWLWYHGSGVIPAKLGSGWKV